MIPRIFLSRRWHEWIPNISYVVAVNGRTLLVDTGSDPAINDLSYMECDPNARFFYQRNMRFIAEPADTVDRQLPELGFTTDKVETIVITHFHGDHPGRIGAFPKARVLTGSGNWPTHIGAVPCTLPAGFTPDFARFEDGPFGTFATSQKLLGRDDVRLIPLPGHTPGHVGVLVKDADRYWLIAGDDGQIVDRDDHVGRERRAVGLSAGLAVAMVHRLRVSPHLVAHLAAQRRSFEDRHSPGHSLWR